MPDENDLPQLSNISFDATVGLSMDNTTDIGFFTIFASIFFVFNATGQIPLFLALLSKFDQKRQLWIITREFLIALFILLLFTFAGDTILMLLGISRSIISVAGGVLLFLISLSMIFPPAQDAQAKHLDKEPLIIPLAIPIITGPGIIAAVMLYAHDTGNPLLVATAAFAAWVPSLGIILAGSLIKQILGEKGLVAIERLGGMLICLIGVQMLASGTLAIVDEYFAIQKPTLRQTAHDPR